MAIQETEEVNLTPESQQHSRRTFKFKQCKSTESEFVFAQRHDMNEFDSNYGQRKRFLTMYLRIFPIRFKLV